MSFLWDSVYNMFARTRNYLVDPPGEENPENQRRLRPSGAGGGQANAGGARGLEYSLGIRVDKTLNTRRIQL